MTKRISVSGSSLAGMALLASLSATFTISASDLPSQYHGHYPSRRMIHEPDENINWFQAPYAPSNWWDAKAWAASFNIGGVTGWRLPAAPSVVDNGIQMVITGNSYAGELGRRWVAELANHAGALTNWRPFDPIAWQSPSEVEGWMDAGTEAFQTARDAIGPAATYPEKFKSGGQDSSLQKVLMRDHFCGHSSPIQSAADPHWPLHDPANAGVRAELQLGILPTDHGGNHTSAPTPTPVTAK